jgi:hypothetical protein
VSYSLEFSEDPTACIFAKRFAILSLMSIRKAGGDWEPMLLGIEPRLCKVCKEGLYRDKTMLRGGWSRCTVCDEFVHYSCLASGKVKFLKQRPRVCLVCHDARDRDKARAAKSVSPPDVAVGS